MEDLSLAFASASDLTGIVPIEVVIAVFAVLVFLMIFIAAFMGYFRTLLSIAAFAYTNARLRAIGNPYIGRMAVADLAGSGSIYEVLEKIRRSGFALEQGEAGSSEDAGRALMSGYFDECVHLNITIPEGIRPFLDAYLMMLEAGEVKSALRMKYGGFTPEIIMQRLTSVRDITPGLIRKMAETEDLEDLILQLHDTRFGEILTHAFQDHATGGHLLTLETALDHFVFQRLHASVLEVDTSLTPPVRRILQELVDTENLKMLLRRIRDGGGHAISDYLLPGRSSLPASTVKRMAESKDVAEVIALLDGTPYRAFLERGLGMYRESGSFSALERALDEALLDAAMTLDLLYTHGPGPLIRFLVARCYEIRNIKAVLLGIGEGLPVRMIESACVWRGEAA